MESWLGGEGVTKIASRDHHMDRPEAKAFLSRTH